MSQDIQNSKLDELNTHLRQTQDFGLRVCQVREKEVMNEHGNQRTLLSGSLFFEALLCDSFRLYFAPKLEYRMIDENGTGQDSSSAILC